MPYIGLYKWFRRQGTDV